MPQNRVRADRPLSRRSRRVGPLIDALEERILFSLTTVVDAVALDGAAVESSPHVVHHAPLSAGDTGGSVTEQAPEFLGFEPVILGEDANDYEVDLSAAFQDPTGGTLRFELLDDGMPELFESVSVEGNRLTLNLARHAFGNADVTVRAISDGGTVDATLPVQVLPMNDRPTTQGFSNVVLDETQARIIIDLFAAFDDIEDADNRLTYTVTGNTHPELFESITVDPEKGHLILLAAPGVRGTSTLTIRATDTEGAYVEMTTDGSSFPVYDEVRSDHQGHATLGLQGMNFISEGVVYDKINGIYDFTRINEGNLRSFLRSAAFDPNLPTVFNIENVEAGNHPAGREIRAQMMRIFWEEQPNAELAGFYGYLPDREWWDSVLWRQAQEDIARGLNTWYAANAGRFQQDYEQWQGRNALLRTVPLQDGSVLADYVTVTHPSLYTFYRYGYVTSAGPVIADVGYDGSTGFFDVPDLPIADGTEIRFNPVTTARLPGGFLTYTSYFVVNSDGHQFQLAAERGGDAIPLDAGAHGTHFLEIIGPRDFLPHDLEFLQWRFYAEEMIAEARKFDVPVIAWISGSMRGVGVDYMDENFFRYQLDTLFDLADGITVWDNLYAASDLPQNQGWFRALSDFVSYIRTPTEFQVRVDTSGMSDGDRLYGQTTHRLDRFERFPFAAGTRSEGAASTGGSRPAGSGPGTNSDNIVLPTANGVSATQHVAVDPALGYHSHRDAGSHVASRHAPLSMSPRIQRFQSRVELLQSIDPDREDKARDHHAIEPFEALAKFPEVSDPGGSEGARVIDPDSVHVSAERRLAFRVSSAPSPAASHDPARKEQPLHDGSTAQEPFVPLDAEIHDALRASSLWRWILRRKSA